MSKDSKELKGKLPIDWCPHCGAKLGDNTVETRAKHDAKEHPLYTKSQLWNDLKRTFRNTRFIIGITIFAIIVGFSCAIIDYFNDLSFDCSKIKSDLNNYTKIHGVDEHVLGELNSTSGCMFNLVVDYSKIKLNDTQTMNSCKSCNYTIASYENPPGKAFNDTKLVADLKYIIGKD